MQYLSLDYWRAHLLELWYGIAGLVLFLIFLFATFPYAPAIKGVLSPLGLRFDSAEQELALPFGARLGNVTIRSLTPGTPTIFQSHSVRIWPALGSLLLLHPGVSGNADSYGGSLWFSVHRLGDGAKVSFDASNLDLPSLHLLHGAFRERSELEGTERRADQPLPRLGPASRRRAAPVLHRGARPGHRQRQGARGDSRLLGRPARVPGQHQRASPRPRRVDALGRDPSRIDLALSRRRSGQAQGLPRPTVRTSGQGSGPIRPGAGRALATAVHCVLT